MKASNRFEVRLEPKLGTNWQKSYGSFLDKAIEKKRW